MHRKQSKPHHAADAQQFRHIHVVYGAARDNIQQRKRRCRKRRLQPGDGRKAPFVHGANQRLNLLDIGKRLLIDAQQKNQQPKCEQNLTQQQP